MIDEEETFKRFGYRSTDLPQRRHRKIVVICDNPNCKGDKVRVIRMDSYSDLCKSCAATKRNIKRFEDPLEHEKTSKANKKRYEDPLEHIKSSNATLKAERDDPTISQRKSKGQIKRFGDPLEREKVSKRNIKNHRDDPELCKRMGNGIVKTYQNKRWNLQVDNFINGNPIIDWIEKPSRQRYGVSEEDNNIWRHLVYERDGYTCQLCGAIHCEVHAHHIIPVRLNQDLMLDINNGITMCPRCHRLTFGKEELYAEELQMMVDGTI